MRFCIGKRALGYLKFEALLGPLGIFDRKFAPETASIVEEERSLPPNYPGIVKCNYLIRSRKFVNVLKLGSGNSTLTIAHQIPKNSHDYGPTLASMTSSYNSLGLLLFKGVA